MDSKTEEKKNDLNAVYETKIHYPLKPLASISLFLF